MILGAKKEGSMMGLMKEYNTRVPKKTVDKCGWLMLSKAVNPIPLLTSPTPQLADIDALLMGVGGRVNEVVRPAVHRLYSRIAQLELELKLRAEPLRYVHILKYGPKGEKLSHDQVMLLDLEPGVQAGEVEEEAALSDADKALE
jgi:hypothetical protein